MKSRICSASRSMATKSPFRTPLACRPWANRFDSRSHRPNVIDDLAYPAEVPVRHLVRVGRCHQPQLVGQEVNHGAAFRGGARRCRPGSRPWARRPGQANGRPSRARSMGRNGWSEANRTRPLPRRDPMNLINEGCMYLARIGRVRKVEIGPLEHVLDEQLLVGVAHVGADDDQIGEVDQHVLEQYRVLAPGPDPRSGDADVDRDGKAQLLTGGVDRVVEGVVEGVLVD